MVHRAFSLHSFFGIVFAPRDWEILFLLRKIHCTRLIHHFRLAEISPLSGHHAKSETLLFIYIQYECIHIVVELQMSSPLASSKVA